jgi:hypothetical protein
LEHFGKYGIETNLEQGTGMDHEQGIRIIRGFHSLYKSRRIVQNERNE